MTDYAPAPWIPGATRAAAKFSNMEDGIDLAHSELATHEAATNPHALSPAQAVAVQAAAGAAKVFVQSTAPSSGVTNGDWWIDTANRIHLTRVSGAWVQCRSPVRYRDPTGTWKTARLYFRLAPNWIEVEYFTLEFQDDFNRGTSASVGNGWSESLATGLDADRIYSSNAPAGGVLVSRQPANRADCRAELVPYSYGIGPMIRDRYAAVVNPANNRTELIEWTSESGPTSVLASSSVLPSFGSSKLRLQGVGAELKVLVDDAEIIVYGSAAFFGAAPYGIVSTVVETVYADNFKLYT